VVGGALGSWSRQSMRMSERFVGGEWLGGVVSSDGGVLC